jgi:predicted esterase
MNRIASLACLSLLIACGPTAGGGEGGGGSGGTADAGPPSMPALPFSCPAELQGRAINEGMNEGYAVDGIERSFHAKFPRQDDSSQPVGVIFSWHGIGDTISNWMRYADLGEADFPFILITPHDTGMEISGQPQGLYWDMFHAESGDDNREAQLFEAVLGCLAETEALDTRRLYTFGFSGGAIIANLIASRYPDQIAAHAALSGAWFNDPAENALIDPEGRGAQFGIDMTPAWPALDTRDRAVLIAHGGATDEYGFEAPVIGRVVILNFEEANQAAIPFLLDHGRTVIDCPHDNGHQPNPAVSPAAILNFFNDHRLGEPSPYLNGERMPAGLSSACLIQQ